MSVFVTAFGGFGAVATHYGFGALGASGVGFLQRRRLRRPDLRVRVVPLRPAGLDATSTPRDVVGQPARVIVPIPRDGVGQVRCQIGEQLVDKIARTRDGAAIPENAAVTSCDVLGRDSVVDSVASAGPCPPSRRISSRSRA